MAHGLLFLHESTQNLFMSRQADAFWVRRILRASPFCRWLANVLASAIAPVAGELVIAEDEELWRREGVRV